MRSNLPGPSQQWGADVDRRLAALERQLNTLSGGNEYNLSRIATVTKNLGESARPRVETATAKSSSLPNRISGFYRFCEVEFSWPEASNYCLLTASSWGYFMGNNQSLQQYVQRNGPAKFDFCQQYPDDEAKQRIWYSHVFGGTDPVFLPVMVTTSSVYRSFSSREITVATQVRGPSVSPGLIQTDPSASFVEMRVTACFM